MEERKVTSLSSRTKTTEKRWRWPCTELVIPCGNGGAKTAENLLCTWNTGNSAATRRGFSPGGRAKEAKPCPVEISHTSPFM